MRGEVQSAVEFLLNLLRCRNLEPSKLECFKQNLDKVLSLHYHNHWFPAKPFRGSGYRCIRVVNNKMDTLLIKAGLQSGLSDRDLRTCLPSELTIWIDPSEVSYRIGEDGSIGVLYNANTHRIPIQSQTSDGEDDYSSQQSSLSSSPPSYHDFSLPVYEYGRCRLEHPKSHNMLSAYVSS